MVKKLIKHEFIYYLRTLGIALPIILVIGIMTRIFNFFDNGNFITDIAIYSSTIMLVIASIALILLSTVISVVRFYKNMYSSEGYLTFTLPVTNHQHILVKLGFAMACQLVSILAVIVAVGIASWEVPAGFTIFKLLSFELLSAYVGTTNAILYIIEGAVLLLLSSAFSFLLYYACITVGQTAKKNRILMAVGAYFIYYVATQTVSTVLIIIMMIISMSGGIMTDVLAWFSANPLEAVHVYFTVCIIFYAILAAVAYIITHRIMTKKLNLE